tara:strand:- start:218 stop:2221 length:2004 start_codon:yes stop_codon:yes gene_type:complete
VASNYEVNIKLDTKQAKDQLRELENRIAKLNRLALKGKASKQILKTDREALAIKIKENRAQDQKIKKDRLELKIAKDNLKVQQQSANITNRQAGGFNRGTGGGGGNQPKGKGIVASALISGSFPLLFGQGLPGAIAGGLGGGIGSAVGGQMGGFAGGLVATAALQVFNNIKDSVNQFGEELNDPAKNLDALTDRVKKFDKSIEVSVSTLKNAGLDQVAGELASLTMQQQFKGLDSVKNLNKEMTKFQQGAAALTTRLSILVAGPLTLLFKTLNLISGSADSANRDLTTTGAIAVQQDKLNKDLKDEAFLLKQIEQERKKLADLDPATALPGDEARIQSVINNFEELLEITRESISKNERLLEIRKLQRDVLLSEGRLLEGQIELQKLRAQVTRGTEDEKAVALKQRQIDLQKVENKLLIAKENLKSLESTGKATEAEIEAQQEKIRNLIKELHLTTLIADERIRAADPALSRIDELNRKMRDLNDTTLQAVNLSKAMGESFEDSFKGIIKGTMTVADAFRNMLNRIADFFLDTAAQLAATQLQRSILGLFGFGGGLSSVPFVPSLGGAGFTGEGGPDPLLGFANGGRPPVGRPSIVGERGPELFVPNSSGTIIPNHNLGSTNIVVNVDASGSSVEGDEEQGRELGRLISVAVQSEIVQQKRPGGLLA